MHHYGKNWKQHVKVNKEIYGIFRIQEWCLSAPSAFRYGGGAESLGSHKLLLQRTGGYLRIVVVKRLDVVKCTQPRAWWIKSSAITPYSRPSVS